MAITRQDVQHVAELARLGLDDAEIDRMVEQLSQVLDAMQVLARLDTSAISPTAQVIPVTSVMREDVPRPSWPREAILSNAPAERDGQFSVPAVLE